MLERVLENFDDGLNNYSRVSTNHENLVKKLFNDPIFLSAVYAGTELVVLNNLFSHRASSTSIIVARLFVRLLKMQEIDCVTLFIHETERSYLMEVLKPYLEEYIVVEKMHDCMVNEYVFNLPTHNFAVWRREIYTAISA